MDIYSEIADAVLAIKSNKELRAAFIKILEIGSYSQQVRVNKVLEHIKPLNPPPAIIRFISLLEDDKIANLVYSELKK